MRRSIAYEYISFLIYLTGNLFHRQLKEAVRESATHTEIYSLFSEKLLAENKKKWLAEVAAFERDKTLPDPYYREPIGMCQYLCINVRGLIHNTGLTEADVRLKLAEEDDKAIADGDAALHAVTPAAMLIDLLEIEELQ